MGEHATDSGVAVRWRWLGRLWSARGSSIHDDDHHRLLLCANILLHSSANTVLLVTGKRMGLVYGSWCASQRRSVLRIIVSRD